MKYPNDAGRIINDAHDENGMAINSIFAVLEKKAPDRINYFTGEDYAAACARCYTARMKFDGQMKSRRPDADASRSFKGNPIINDKEE